MRITCLLPEASEILAAIGGSSMLVGELDPNAPPNQIQSQLAQHNPDLVLAGPEHASSLGDVPAMILSISTIEDLFDTILNIGQAVGLEGQALRLTVSLRGRMHSAMDFVNPYFDGPAVAILDGLAPLSIAGLWSVQLIERAGGRCPWNPTTAAPDAGAAAGPQMAYRSAGPSRRITEAELAAEPPEFLVLAPRGLNRAQARAEAEALAAHDWFRSLPAFKASNIALVDGAQMFNTPGPKLIDAFEFLVGFLNDRPEQIPADFPWAIFQMDNKTKI